MTADPGSSTRPPLAVRCLQFRLAPRGDPDPGSLPLSTSTRALRSPSPGRPHTRCPDPSQECPPIRPAVPSPLWVPSLHTRCPKPSRGLPLDALSQALSRFPLSPAIPAPLGVFSPQTGQNRSRTPVTRVFLDLTPPRVLFPRLTLSPSRAPVLSPQTCCHHPRARRLRRRFLSHTCSRVALLPLVPRRIPGSGR